MNAISQRESQNRETQPRQAHGRGSQSRETQIVGFRVGRETYGIPIMALHEIVRVPEITAVPDAPAHLEGVINLRGKIVSVKVDIQYAAVDGSEIHDGHPREEQGF